MAIDEQRSKDRARKLRKRGRTGRRCASSSDVRSRRAGDCAQQVTDQLGVSPAPGGERASCNVIIKYGFY